MILFLDFDGVLHKEPCHDTGMLMCNLPRMEAILRDFPGVDVVISSTWRELLDLEQLRSYFSPYIAPRIIGVTPDWREVSHLFAVVGSYIRQVEIEGWLQASGRSSEQWVALDDRAYLFAPSIPNLVCCAPDTGIDDGVESALRKKLATRIPP